MLSNEPRKKKGEREEKKRNLEPLLKKCFFFSPFFLFIFSFFTSVFVIRFVIRRTSVVSLEDFTKAPPLASRMFAFRRFTTIQRFPLETEVMEIEMEDRASGVEYVFIFTYQ